MRTLAIPNQEAGCGEGKEEALAHVSCICQQTKAASCEIVNERSRERERQCDICSALLDIR